MLNLNCPICLELYTSTDQVHVTACGHLFHSVCLEPWVEETETCPQCRHDITADDVMRVFFNTANIDESSVDVGALTAQLDDVTLQFKLKEKACKALEEDIKILTGEKFNYTNAMLGMAKEKAVFESYVIYLQELNRIFSAKVVSDLRAELDSLKQQHEMLESQSQERGTTLCNELKRLHTDLRKVEVAIDEGAIIIKRYNNILLKIDAENTENTTENLMKMLYPNGKNSVQVLTENWLNPVRID